MGKPLAIFAFMVVATLAFGQATPPPIDAAAVWQPTANFLTTTRATCDKVTPSSKFSDCVISEMSKAGASAAAVSFTRELFKDTGGEVGILAAFHGVGPIDIGWVQYPLRSTNGLVLLNGKPRIVNAEDLKLLDEKDMQQSFQFQDLQNQFPQVAVFPGDRDGKTWPNSQTGNKGGLQFIIGYPLRNGCRTCAHAGFALFTWNFNSSGKFTGTTFMGMTPAPVAPSGQSGSQP